VVRIEGPFIGAEAIDSGLLRKHQLRSQYSALFPGVYLSANLEPTFDQRAEAAWLWSRRNGVIGGLTAARLHGAKWVDDVAPVELIWSNGRPPPGIKVFKDRLGAAEHILRDGLTVTTVTRTAFDLGRRGRLGQAVARIDALANATDVSTVAIAELADSHRGSRGIRQLRSALALCDAGAQSPRETWLRLLVMRAGFPRPQTQIPVVVYGRRTYYLDMGWTKLMLAVEYDGDHHRADAVQFSKDITRLEELAAMGWTIIRVVAGTPPVEVVARVRRAWEASKAR